jgi:two-component system, NarL family, nitrate/nitrite response regulator NarL
MDDRKIVARIIIADDHALFRAALRKLLELEPGFLVIGEAGNSTDTVTLVERLHPDILLLDMDMPYNQSGLEVLNRATNLASNTRIVLLVTAMQRLHVIEALRLGARGILHKDTASQLLYKCIHTVMDDKYWIGHDFVGELIMALRTPAVSEFRNSDKYGLKHREFEILSAVVDGCTNREIADKLTISEQTVKHYLTGIYGKVGVSNRLELALFAMNKQLVRAM